VEDPNAPFPVRRFYQRLHRRTDVERPTSARQALQVPAKTSESAPRVVFDKYCITCHSQKLHTAGLDLETLDVANPGTNAEVWEKIILKLRAGSMPPPGSPRPDTATYRTLAALMERVVDKEWNVNPNPGRIGAVQRLNRAEYNNVIRDLFALDVNVKPLLPGDDTADGSFDNFADSLSISHRAPGTIHVGRATGRHGWRRDCRRLVHPSPPLRFAACNPGRPPKRRLTSGIPWRHGGELRISGGWRISHQGAPSEAVSGLPERHGWPQQLDVRLDGKLLKRFSVGGKATGRPAAASFAGDGEPGFAGDDSWEKYMQIGGDAGLEVRLPVTAGPHIVGVSFVREMWEPEGLPQPLQRGRVITNDQVYMDYANVGSFQIGGPYQISGMCKRHPEPSNDFRLPAQTKF
jgi:hypothetical protein